MAGGVFALGWWALAAGLVADADARTHTVAAAGGGGDGLRVVTGRAGHEGVGASAASANRGADPRTAVAAVDDAVSMLEIGKKDDIDPPLEANPTLGDPRELTGFRDLSDGITIPRGKRFNTTCECSSAVGVPLTLKMPMEYPGGCASSDLKVKLDTRGQGYSKDEVQGMINPIYVSWAKIDETHFSGIEGRTVKPVLAIPGGDMAEFINALDVYEEHIHFHLSDGHCLWYLRRFLQLTRKRSFYMSTDSIATRQLGVSLGMTGLDLRDTPSPGDWARLLDALSLPEHIGNMHLRAMVMKPDEYDVRPGLPRCALRAFFTLLWNKREPMGRKLRLVELSGVGKEKAVLKIKSSKTCNKLRLAPLIVPKSHAGTFFVSHQEAAEHYRKEYTNYFARFHRWIDGKRFLKIMNQNGKLYERLAIWRMARLARNLPVYEVKFV